MEQIREKSCLHEASILLRTDNEINKENIWDLDVIKYYVEKILGKTIENMCTQWFAILKRGGQVIQRRHTDGQQTLEKMLSIANY